MTINSLRQFSTTRLSNTDLGGGTVAENTMLPSGVNNAFREFMGEVAEWLVEMSYPTAGGTADALTLTPTTALAAYANNVVYTFTAASSNATTSPTLNISALGAKQLRKISAGADVALAAGDIQAKGKYAVVYSTTANSSAGGWIVVGKDGTHLLKSANLSDLASASTALTNLGATSTGSSLFTAASAAAAMSMLGAFGVIRIQVFSASGTYTPDAHLLYAFVQIVGAGGSAGSVADAAASQIAASSGGGAGGYAQKVFTAATIGASQTVTIGTGGSAPAAGANNGNNGGTTSFGALLSAAGGIHGTGAASGTVSNVPGAAGGAGSGGDVNATGGASTQALGVASVPYVMISNGASSFFGGGGAGGAQVNGTAGVTGGGGGGTYTYNGTTAKQGGAGGNGLVVITEYCSQ